MFPWLSNILSRLLIDRKGGHRRSVLAKYREFLRVSGLTAEEIRDHQDRQLAELLNHAKVHVPFWKEAMNDICEITPENAREVYARLPVMERSAVQSNFDGFTWKGIEAVKDATGGSSGTPMNFLVDPETHVCGEATMYWSNHLAGWRYGCRVAMLWGSDRDVGNAKKDPRYQWRCWIDNIRWYNSFDMGPDRMAQFHEDMCRFKPHVIVGYAGSLEIFAKFLRDNVQHSTLNAQRSNGEEVAGCRLQVEGEDSVQCSEFGVRGRGEENFQRSTLNIQHSSGGSSNSFSQSKIQNPEVSTNRSRLLRRSPDSPSTLAY